MKVSVVVPVYNAEKFLLQSINSILEQTFTDFELLLINDGSTDRSAEICEKFKERDVRVRVFHKSNGGVSSARNLGILKSRADLIAFMDSDDYWSKNHLAELILLVSQYPDACAYTTSYYFDHGYGQIFPANYKLLPKPPWSGIIEDYFLNSGLSDHLINSSSILIKKNILKETGVFEESLPYGEDIDLWVRIVLSGKLAFTYSGQSYYRVHKIRVAPCDRMSVGLNFIKSRIENAYKYKALPVNTKLFLNKLASIEVFNLILAGQSVMARVRLRKLEAGKIKKMKYLILSFVGLSFLKKILLFRSVCLSLICVISSLSKPIKFAERLTKISENPLFRIV